MVTLPVRRLPRVSQNELKLEELRTGTGTGDRAKEMFGE